MKTLHLSSAPVPRRSRPSRPGPAPLLALGLATSLLAAPSALAQAVARQRAAQAPAQPPAVSTLQSVKVEQKRGTTTAPYAGGQVAAGGQVGLLGARDFMETPFSIISYTDDYIQDRQAKDITDVIAATDPTVFSNGVSGAWSENYAIRGFASGTTDMTINGLAGMAPFYRTSPEMFDRIEVLKGPSALLNGMPPGGSVGGTVNLVTKRAGDVPLTRVTLNHTSDAQFGAHLDLGRRIGRDQQVGIRFNGVYRDGSTAVDHQDKKLQMGALAVDWRGHRARLSADLYHADDHIDGPARGVSLAPGLAVPKAPKAGTQINPDWGFVQTRDKGAMVRGELDLGERTLAYAAFGGSRTDYKYNGSITAQILDPAGTFNTVIGQLAFDVEKRSADIGMRGQARTGTVGHRWALNLTHYDHEQNDYGRRSVPGADWVTNLYHPVWSPSVPLVTPHIAHTKLRLQSLGIADTLSFAEDRIQLTVGVRRQTVVSDSYDVASGARTSRYDESATTPAAALLVKAGDRLSFYGNYMEGLSQGATAPMTAVNAGEVFAPFTTRQREAGFKLDLGTFTHSVGLFEITRPSSYTDPVSNVFSFGGEQRNRGVEWGFAGAPVENVRLMGGVSYVDPVLTRTAGGVNQGRLATGVPKRQAKLGGEWDLSWLPGLTLTAGATALSRQYISADNTLSVAGRTLYDVGARYATDVGGHRLTLRSGIANLTNKAYWGMPLLSSLALGAPRTFQLSATMDF
ncbi:TonB-dependent receptor [Stenotrophomonas mori]|uniref:TonB-dependent siderophore receptor n=1 Tax=Stenotrophomonas mori TaxID=2871096 RepID=A0ABT0SET9_9GAMM|nr:TonB-dependent siderophore receptor [Stenotrophomonas mori]MCL7713829.1 TonB-dependent siderophore receptor [Stenotrophomonas mori]